MISAFLLGYLLDIDEVTVSLWGICCLFALKGGLDWGVSGEDAGGFIAAARSFIKNPLFEFFIPGRSSGVCWRTVGRFGVPENERSFYNEKEFPMLRSVGNIFTLLKGDSVYFITRY